MLALLAFTVIAPLCQLCRQGCRNIEQRGGAQELSRQPYSHRRKCPLRGDKPARRGFRPHPPRAMSISRTRTKRTHEEHIGVRIFRSALQFLTVFEVTASKTNHDRTICVDGTTGRKAFLFRGTSKLSESFVLINPWRCVVFARLGAILPVRGWTMAC